MKNNCGRSRDFWERQRTWETQLNGFLCLHMPLCSIWDIFPHALPRPLLAPPLSFVMAMPTLYKARLFWFCLATPFLPGSHPLPPIYSAPYFLGQCCACSTVVLPPPPGECYFCSLLSPTTSHYPLIVARLSPLSSAVSTALS